MRRRVVAKCVLLSVGLSLCIGCKEKKPSPADWLRGMLSSIEKNGMKRGGRHAAATAMGYGERLLPMLLEATRHKSADVRRFAVLALGRKPSEAKSAQAVVSALAAAIKDKKVGVRLAAIKSLKQHKSEKATVALFGALRDRSGLMRSEAEALLRTWKVSQMPLLLDAYRNPHAHVRIFAINMISLYGVWTPKAKALLQKALKDKDEGVRKWAVFRIEKHKASTKQKK